MERRPFGRTGERLSIIGFGGILVDGVTPEQAASLVAEAVDRGINYFDVAPSYGNAQERLGPALRPYRDKVFLACKTLERKRDGARRELEESLRLLQTDRIDLYQLHAMTTGEDFEQAMGPGGALEAIVEAREQGLVRYIGFSAHSEQVALRLLDAFAFDSVLFPVNWVSYLVAGFGKAIMQRAEQVGAARLALKALARARLAPGQPRVMEKCWYEPITDREEAALALRFTLSQPVTAAIPPGEVQLWRWALDTADHFTPVSEDERDRLYRRAEGLVPLFPLPA
ncbi:MAG: aldo/keto reductase [Limnochordaceae bacterium]|nr:aldo/keto reductase [Limnochordaceae bacterium]